jgi:hypothetical protein
MTNTAQIPDFAAAEWYRDPKDHRCPHDGWLEALEITEPANGDRNQVRSTAIAVRLLGAYHDGHIIFRYSGVQNYSLVAASSAQGLGDWLDDEILAGDRGLLVHRIRWSGHTEWTIEAREVSYEWILKS